MEISWCVELEIRPGKINDFKELSRNMVEATKAEPGILIYERFINEKNLMVFVYERYIDPAAALTNLKKFKREYGKKFSTLVIRKLFRVFGTPSNDLKETLDEFDATYFNIWRGFHWLFTIL